jgi:hypothetical protein
MCSHPLKKRKRPKSRRFFLPSFCFRHLFNKKKEKNIGKARTLKHRQSKLSQIQLTETGERGLLTPKEGGFRGFREFRA